MPVDRRPILLSFTDPKSSRPSLIRQPPIKADWLNRSRQVRMAQAILCQFVYRRHRRDNAMTPQLELINLSRTW